MAVVDRRSEVLRRLADIIAQIDLGHPARVAVDGRTASGKTTLAKELAEALRGRARPVILTSIDGFHRPRAERYRRGRHSAEGYYRDARDLGAIRRLLLDRLGPGGDRLYRTASFDLERDTPLEVPAQPAPDNAILLVDGTFLQRRELAPAWDFVIFVEVPAEVARARGIARDSAHLGGHENAAALHAARYEPAFGIYASECDPLEGADAVLVNADPAAPELRIRGEWRVANSE